MQRPTVNPDDFATKAVEVTKHPKLDYTQTGDVTVRLWHYPDPGSGVALYTGPRGESEGGIDWGVDRLREGIANLVTFVYQDCVAVVSELDGIDADSKQRIVRAIQDHFEQAD